MKDRICYSISQEGIVTWISKNVSEIMGWLPEEVIGQHFFFFIPPDRHEDMVQRRLNRLSGITDEYFTEVLRKDGSREPVRIRVLQTPENTVGMIDRRLKQRDREEVK
jgi:PAS domain S-box-containing protein